MQSRINASSGEPCSEASGLLSEMVGLDLHQESFIWTRLLGYDMAVEHPPGPLGGRLLGQSDLPRLVRSGLASSVQSIATSVAQPRSRRTGVLLENLETLRRMIDGTEGFSVVRTVTGLEQARSRGEHGCFLAVQGGNGLSDPSHLERLPPGLVSRITLVHMSDSWVGRTSNPLGGILRGRGLTDGGRELVQAMNQKRILVDLSHMHESGFLDALTVHDRTIPPLVSHTGVRGVHDSWRNLGDHQIRAIAERGGVVGVFAHLWALGPPHVRMDASVMVRHMEHVIRVGGEECAALGTDLDGFILPPADMRSVDRLYVLVQHMMDRGWKRERIRRVMGGNALRVMRTALT